MIPDGVTAAPASQVEAASETEDVAGVARDRSPGAAVSRPGGSDLWRRLAGRYEIGRVGGCRFAWSEAEDPLTGEGYIWVEHVSAELVATRAAFDTLLERLPPGPVRVMYRTGANRSDPPGRLRTWFVCRRIDPAGPVDIPAGAVVSAPDKVCRRYVRDRLVDALLAGYGWEGTAPPRSRAESTVAELLTTGHISLVASTDDGVPVGHITWSDYHDPVSDRGYLDILDTWIEEPWQGRNLTETLLAHAVRRHGATIEVLGNVTPTPDAPYVLARLLAAGWRFHGMVIER